MSDAYAFPPDTQSEYAFPSTAQGDGNDPDQAEQRNQQIQSSFDQQRFQRNMIQGVAKTLESDRAQIAQLRAQQQKS